MIANVTALIFLVVMTVSLIVYVIVVAISEMTLEIFMIGMCIAPLMLIYGLALERVVEWIGEKKK